MGARWQLLRYCICEYFYLSDLNDSLFCAKFIGEVIDILFLCDSSNLSQIMHMKLFVAFGV